MRELVLSAVGSIWLCAGSVQGQVTLPFPAQYELSTLLPANGGTGENGLAINGISEGDFSGHAVSAAGDVNGDGVEDLIIGAVLVGNAQSLYVGESYVVFGGTHLGSAGNLELASLNGTNGFRIEATIPVGHSGSAVASAGDVNNDGYDDVIVASSIPSNFSFGSGDCHVIFGGQSIGASGTLSLASIDGTNGFAIDASDMLNFGGRPAAAGDLNDDGIDDFIIGVPHADPNGDRSGMAYVVFGKQGLGSEGTLDLAMLDGTDGFAINGKDPVDNFGTSVAPAGDFNMDGIDDIIVGAFRGDPNGLSSGESYIIFGAHNIGAGGSIEVSALNGTNGFVLNGIDQSDESGYTVAPAGDVNGDNADDIIIGAHQADPNGDDSGETYVVFGGMNVGNSGSLELSDLDGTNGFVLYGENPNDESGLSISQAGDLNNDGYDDILVGACFGLFAGNTPGKAYLVFGSQSVGAAGTLELTSLNGANGFVLNGVKDNDSCGSSLAYAGDVNNDGIDDIIIGAPEADPFFVPPYRGEGGQSYIVFGRDYADICRPDTNHDGQLTGADFTAWIDAFNNSLPECDQNNDGSCTQTDFTAWIANYNAGCD